MTTTSTIIENVGGGGRGRDSVRLERHGTHAYHQRNGLADRCVDALEERRVGD